MGQTKKGIIEHYILWATEEGLCDQCVRPWNDGLCECKTRSHEYIEVLKKKQKIVIELIHDLMKSGVPLENIRKL